MWQSYLPALAGGAVIGIAASALLFINGRVAGVSSIAAGLLPPAVGEAGWRLSFVGGLVAGGVLLKLLSPATIGAAEMSGALWPVGAGLLVGVGTRLGGGCTSGHGVCGLARGSPRSLAAVMVFMGVAALTVFVWRHWLGVHA